MGHPNVDFQGLGEGVKKWTYELFFLLTKECLSAENCCFCQSIRLACEAELRSFKNVKPLRSKTGHSTLAITAIVSLTRPQHVPLSLLAVQQFEWAGNEAKPSKVTKTARPIGHKPDNRIAGTTGRNLIVYPGYITGHVSVPKTNIRRKFVQYPSSAADAVVAEMWTNLAVVATE